MTASQSSLIRAASVALRGETSVRDALDIDVLSPVHVGAPIAIDVRFSNDDDRLRDAQSPMLDAEFRRHWFTSMVWEPTKMLFCIRGALALVSRRKLLRQIPRSDRPIK
jgi:hypothetical protein